MAKKTDIWEGITDENKRIIVKYGKHRISDGKGEGTIANDMQALRKLAKKMGKRSILKATINDMKEFFSDKKYVKSKTSADPLFSAFLKFDQYQFNLSPRERSKRLKWYVRQTKQEKNKGKNREEEIKKKFITREEYDNLIESCTRLQSRAMWETLYLSGIRPDELLSMRLNSIIEKDNGWEIKVKRSKTKPRYVPLAETPSNLLKWAREHPFKGDKESPLWFSETNKNYGDTYKSSCAVDSKLRVDIGKANRKGRKIRDSITPKCFRATRATIMFGARSEDGGLIFSDSEMALNFGWTLKEVPARREDYDLTPYNSLRERVFAQSQKPPSPETIAEENRMLKEGLNIDRIIEEKAKLENTIENARRYAKEMNEARLEAESSKAEAENMLGIQVVNTLFIMDTLEEQMKIFKNSENQAEREEKTIELYKEWSTKPEKRELVKAYARTLWNQMKETGEELSKN